MHTLPLFVPLWKLLTFMWIITRFASTVTVPLCERSRLWIMFNINHGWISAEIMKMGCTQRKSKGIWCLAWSSIESGRFVKNKRISVGSQIEVMSTIVLKTNLVTKFRYGLKEIETEDTRILRRLCFSLTVVWRRQSSLLSTLKFKRFTWNEKSPYDTTWTLDKHDQHWGYRQDEDGHEPEQGNHLNIILAKMSGCDWAHWIETHRFTG